MQSRLARGRNLSRRNVDGMRGLREIHTLPYFKDKSLSTINRPMIEDWIIKLSKKEG